MGYTYSRWHGWGGVILIALAFLTWIGVGFVTAHLNNSVQTITVTSVDDQATGRNGHQYLIFTPEGVFKDTDNIWLGKFNSSDLYNQLSELGKFTCRVHGVRQHLTSNYPDLMSCARVP